MWETVENTPNNLKEILPEILPETDSKYGRKIIDITTGKQHSFYAYGGVSLRTLVRMVAVWIIQTTSRLLNIMFEIALFMYQVIFCEVDLKETDDKKSKYIIVEFLIWDFNGTDNLLASIIKNLWKEVGSELSSSQIKLHRLSVYLVGDLKNCSPLQKEKKWIEAPFQYFLTLFLLLFVAAIVLDFGVYLILQHVQMEVKDEVIKIPTKGVPISILVSFSIFIQQS